MAPRKTTKATKARKATTSPKTSLPSPTSVVEGGEVINTAVQRNPMKTVIVALNYPRGIKFQVDGGRRTVLLNGNAEGLRGYEKGIIPIGKFGYTEISEDDWNEIRSTYGCMEIFKSGLIFAQKDARSAEDEAKDMAETRHGIEPIDTKQTKTTEVPQSERG